MDLLSHTPLPGSSSALDTPISKQDRIPTRAAPIILDNVQGHSVPGSALTAFSSHLPGHLWARIRVPPPSWPLLVVRALSCGVVHVPCVQSKGCTSGTTYRCKHPSRTLFPPPRDPNLRAQLCPTLRLHKCPDLQRNSEALDSQLGELQNWGVHRPYQDRLPLSSLPPLKTHLEARVGSFWT